jgi:glycosyltransferase involved in cell wall biosynthesis
MRIAVLTCGILPIPAVQGGAVENLIEFYLEYNHRMKRHDITVYSPWDYNIPRNPLVASFYNHFYFISVTTVRARIERKLYQLTHRKQYYNYFIEYYFEKVYAHLKRQRYDMILLENCPGYAYKLHKRGYNNLVLHLHNELLHSESRYHDIIFNSLSKIITVSDYIKQRVSTIQPSNKIQTVHNGIDLALFSRVESTDISRQSVGFSSQDFVLIYSGRINQEKGVAELIDAMLLLKNHPQVKLLIIGGSFFGNTNDEDAFIRSLKAKAKEIEDKIVFTGFVPYQQIPAYLQMADVAVIPSIWNDPFPTTELEAQAMGLPIITTRRGGIPEEVSEQNAILLDTDQHLVENLAKAILQLYEHPEQRQQMAAASLERSQLFDKTTYAKNFFAALESL